MPIDRRLIQTVTSHCAALMVGWSVWAMHASGSNASASAAESVKTRQKASKGGVTADEILAIIAPANPASSKSPAEWKSRRAAFLTDFPDLVMTMPMPDDLGAALKDEVKLWEKDGYLPSARLAALMYQWATTDPQGLMTWLGNEKDSAKEKGDARGSAAATFLGSVIQQMAIDKGVDSVLPILNSTDWSNTAIFSTAGAIGESGNLQILSELKEKLVPNQWTTSKFFLSSQWSWEKKSNLVEFAVSESQPELLANFGRFQRDDPARAASWMLGLIQDESLDAGFREKLAGAEKLKDIAISSANLPMDQRITLMQGGETAAPDQHLYDDLARTDVMKLLIQGRDWPYEFRHGNVEASEVLASISDELSQTNAKAPEAVRMTVFQNLVEEDSARAMELLNGLSSADRANAVIDAAQNCFFRVHPDVFLATLQQVPSDDPQLWDARLDAWVRHGPENYERLDAEYVGWVRALPEGVDRDMALYSLAVASGKDNPSLAAELRSEVKDEKLKRRISEKP